MTEISLLIVIIIAILIAIRLIKNNRTEDGYNRGTDNYDRGSSNYNKGTDKVKLPKYKKKPISLFGKEEKKSFRSSFSEFFSSPLPFDEEAISWCTNLLAIDKSELKAILRHIKGQYKVFNIRKRSGGYRTISAPSIRLLAIQKTIYHRILLPVNLHPAATGFRKDISITHNARPHLGKDEVLKTDIIDFFDSIHQYTVVNAFKKIGYPSNISKLLAELCCLRKRLPQGAPTSPALSNIIAYEMDKKLIYLSAEYDLTYTRYADDLIFSGNNIPYHAVLSKITEIIKSEGFALKISKNRHIDKNRRKIITGISISSGKKLTIPKAKKREIRKNVYFILTRGLVEHQKHIGSHDPSYLKRLLGYLSFWHSVEPENKYVTDSISALKKLRY